MTRQTYDPATIEPKWQRFWAEQATFRTPNPGEPGFDGKRPKYYVLDMFPYPSGAGLHVGHPEGYTATDILARCKRMQGCNVLHPMGWDAFGLPAEQHALQTGTHRQVLRFAILMALGLSGCVSETIGWEVDMEPIGWRKMRGWFEYSDHVLSLRFSTLWSRDTTAWAGQLEVRNNGLLTLRMTVNPETNGRRAVWYGDGRDMEFISSDHAIDVRAGSLVRIHLDAISMGVSHPPVPGQRLILDLIANEKRLTNSFVIRTVQPWTEVKPALWHK
jgi:hypothetical protein